eukprot:Phypoly_transcript_01667.p1 GENE.Phypoly_transcript_01667~~Phypoly_transcript_01667.p1  ORF type:complete len:513 (+),score=63.30 Phypoly_transcript_01667:1623-3161(+)
MAQQPTNHSQGTATTPSQQDPYNCNYSYQYAAYNYYLQAGYNTYYNNTNYTVNTGYNYTTPNTSANTLSYPPAYASYTPNYTLPTPHTSNPTTGQDANNSIEQTEHNTEQDTVSRVDNLAPAHSDDPSQAPHFWDDCEYINYALGAELCEMCGEEVEDDTELQEHLKVQHHVVFFACTSCRTVFGDLNALRDHECHPYVLPEPPATQQLNTDQQTNNKDKKRKRGPPAKPQPPPKPAIVEKVRLNEFGAVYISPQKRSRLKPNRGPAQIQDILQWQQNYNTTQQEETGGGELVVRDEGGTITLTREMLLEAKDSADGLSVEIDRMPASAIVCRICSLLFASSHQLNRHAGFSKTHKKNVDFQRRQEQKAIRFDVTGDTTKKAGPLGDNGTYRDRSAERRAENPEGCPLDYQPYDTVTDYVAPDAPIEASNVGRKLLESMGWKEGKGLGKNEVGMVNPIMTQKNFRGAGLGMEINQHEVAAQESSTYTDYLRNKKLARYAELSKTIRDPVVPH